MVGMTCINPFVSLGGGNLHRHHTPPPVGRKHRAAEGSAGFLPAKTSTAGRNQRESIVGGPPALCLITPSTPLPSTPRKYTYNTAQGNGVGMYGLGACLLYITFKRDFGFSILLQIYFAGR
uniref:uncharacterized protein LOC117160448 n=1 Tax=Bombus vancouverensis nearcticus TaxID=2705178 RepID=UPI001439F65D|nr:uncharacterized protein LOC117160448 [Bombus vancouverensis nearcticus]